MDDVLLVTPEEINDSILQFCAEVSPRREPCYVSVKPESYSKINDCFNNVKKKVDQDGGSIEHGWQIWIWPNIFIEAEFHAVWNNCNNKYIDITKKEDDCDKILFLPDSRIKYEGYWVDSIRRNISNHKLVDLYIDINECGYLLLTSEAKPYIHQYELSDDQSIVYKDLSDWGNAIRDMLKDGLSRSSLCPCGSRIKFKKCCEKRLINIIQKIKRFSVNKPA